MTRFYLRTVALILTLALLAGCGVANKGVRSVITRHSDFPQSGLNGSFVVAPLESQNGSVEFGQYARYVEEKLVAQGFRKAVDPNSADYVVMFEYGVGGSRQYITTSHTGTKTDVSSKTVYDRFFNLKIFDMKRSEGANLVGVYEGTVKSAGSSQNFSTVSYCMIDALFRDFFTNGTDDSDLSLINRMGDLALGGNTKCMQ